MMTLFIELPWVLFCIELPVLRRCTVIVVTTPLLLRCHWYVAGYEHTWYTRCGVMPFDIARPDADLVLWYFDGEEKKEGEKNSSTFTTPITDIYAILRFVIPVLLCYRRDDLMSIADRGIVVVASPGDTLLHLNRLRCYICSYVSRDVLPLRDDACIAGYILLRLLLPLNYELHGW